MQLTDRAFQITTGHQQLAPLEAVFDMPFIDWSRPLDPIELTERLYFSYGVSRSWYLQYSDDRGPSN